MCVRVCVHASRRQNTGWMAQCTLLPQPVRALRVNPHISQLTLYTLRVAMENEGPGLDGCDDWPGPRIARRVTLATSIAVECMTDGLWDTLPTTCPPILPLGPVPDKHTLNMIPAGLTCRGFLWIR